MVMKTSEDGKFQMTGLITGSEIEITESNITVQWWKLCGDSGCGIGLAILRDFFQALTFSHDVRSFCSSIASTSPVFAPLTHFPESC